MAGSESGGRDGDDTTTGAESRPAIRESPDDRSPSEGRGRNRHEGTDRPTRHWLRLADLAWYALVVAGLVTGAAMAISFPIGGAWLVVKYVLFVVGILVVAVAAFLLRPRAAWKEPKSAEERTPTRLETMIQRLPPLRDAPLAADERISPPAKLLVAGLVILAVSFALEAWFGITI